ncbi:hypothetical protein NDN08_000225 [Rhodosorus marinus]|uniref:Uncharacterized protein n=1 Tax=Rhodosorus marinus TaxID=101924 RepID=A0AAV8UI17_9RHOD|nr:hypothetical protein NDN08_000225 [Rhodosorus marinus]
MMGMRNLRIGVVVSLFVGLCYASPVSLKASVRETDGVSCAASLSRAGLVRLGVDSTSTKKCRPLLRRKRIAGFDLSGVPRRMGRVCVALNEDGDKVELRFKIDDIGFGFTQVRGGVYATEDEIPTDFDEAYATSESFPKEVEKHTLVLALDEIDRDCCRDGIIVMWTAVVGPTTYAGNVPKQMTVHPSGGTSVTAFCKRRAGTKQRICEMDFTCSGCPLDETGISGGTCIVSTCPHVGSLVAPIDCTLRNARINESCDHFGDLGNLWESMIVNVNKQELVSVRRESLAVITVDQRGNCKCTQKCVNIDCPAGIAGCSPQQGKIGDICVPKTDGDSTGEFAFVTESETVCACKEKL